MVANNDIPKITESISYTAIQEPNFLEYAIFLHDHGYKKELTIQELREEIEELYRERKKLRDMKSGDVWR